MNEDEDLTNMLDDWALTRMESEVDNYRKQPDQTRTSRLGSSSKMSGENRQRVKSILKKLTPKRMSSASGDDTPSDKREKLRASNTPRKSSDNKQCTGNDTPTAASCSNGGEKRPIKMSTSRSLAWSLPRTPRRQKSRHEVDIHPNRDRVKADTDKHSPRTTLNKDKAATNLEENPQGSTNVAGNLTGIAPLTTESDRIVQKLERILHILRRRKLFEDQRSRTKSPKTEVRSDTALTDGSRKSESSDDSRNAVLSPKSCSSLSMKNMSLRNLSSKRGRKQKTFGEETRSLSEGHGGTTKASPELCVGNVEGFFIDDDFPDIIASDAECGNDERRTELSRDFEEWSFDELQGALDASQDSFGDKVRRNVRSLMKDIRKTLGYS